MVGKGKWGMQLKIQEVKGMFLFLMKHKSISFPK